MDDPDTVQLGRIKNRRDFLAARNGPKYRRPTFLVQARKRSLSVPSRIDDNIARFGITVTKKVGNSVVRNRIRRRLREVIRLNAQSCAAVGNDYVLIAREPSLNVPFSALVSDFVAAMEYLSQKLPLTPGQQNPISTHSGQIAAAKQPEPEGRPDKSASSQPTGSQSHGK